MRFEHQTIPKSHPLLEGVEIDIRPYEIVLRPVRKDGSLGEAIALRGQDMRRFKETLDRAIKATSSTISYQARERFYESYGDSKGEIEHPKYTKAKWKAAIAADKTEDSYPDWVWACLEEEDNRHSRSKEVESLPRSMEISLEIGNLSGDRPRLDSLWLEGFGWLLGGSQEYGGVRFNTTVSLEAPGFIRGDLPDLRRFQKALLTRRGGRTKGDSFGKPLFTVRDDRDERESA